LYLKLQKINLSLASLFNDIRNLLVKEFTLEWRNRFSLNGLLLYVISTIFVCYLTFKNIIEPSVWNALFWIIILFVSTQAAFKSFFSESKGRLLYLYTLCNPQAVILSKMVYNMLLIAVIAIISYMIYALVLGNLVENIPLFIIGLITGSMGLSAILTMMSAISSKTSNGSTIMVILSFPVVLPLLMTIIKFSNLAIMGFFFKETYPYLIALAGLNLISITLSYLLFPYLWRE
jgi:heme exporter protein B